MSPSNRSFDKLPLEKQKRLQRNKEKWTRLLKGGESIENGTPSSDQDDDILQKNYKASLILPELHALAIFSDDVEKLPQLLSDQESDNTVSTVSSSSSEIDDSLQDKVVRRSPVKNKQIPVKIVEKEDLATRLQQYMQEKKGELPKASVNTQTREDKKKKLPTNDFVLPLHKIRLGNDEDSDNGDNANDRMRSRTMLRAQRDMNTDKQLDKKVKNVSSSDDDSDSGNDPMESLRVKRIYNVRQKEEEKKASENLIEKQKKQRQFQLKEKAYLSKRRIMELEMSAPITPMKIINQDIGSQSKNNQNAKLQLKQREEPIANDPPSSSTESAPTTPMKIINQNIKSQSKTNQIAELQWKQREEPNASLSTESVEPSPVLPDSPSTTLHEDEERRQKLLKLKQMFENGLECASDSESMNNLPTQIDFPTEEEILKALGATVEGCVNDLAPQEISPLTPSTPPSVKRSRDIESKWLDNLFSDVQ